jgi:Cysteine rich repeat
MRNALLPVLAVAAALAAPAPAARADMMSACASEIGKFCSAVSKGRGRISACLAAHMDQLGSACQPEVQAVMQGRLTPGYVRKALDPSFRAPLPQSCTGPAAQFCPGMASDRGPVFACLYAFSDRVPRACSDAAQATLKQAQ